MERLSEHFITGELVRTISDHIALYRLDGRQYIVKEMEPTFDRAFCRDKADYIGHLLEQGVRTAPVSHILTDRSRVFEVQEYLPGAPAGDFCPEQAAALAEFHQASARYSGPFRNLPVRPADTVVCGRRLNRLLIGFEEKFFRFPADSLNNLPMEERDREPLARCHARLYDAFRAGYGIDDCIIHNDLTSANMLRLEAGGYAFIDFDFSIRSSVYVDLADMMLTRTWAMEDYPAIFREKREWVEEALAVYRRHNPAPRVAYRGFALMAALKLFTFAFYLYAPVNGLTANQRELLLQVGQMALDAG